MFQPDSSTRRWRSVTAGIVEAVRDEPLHAKLAHVAERHRRASGIAGQAVPRLLLIPEMTDWVTREGGAEAFGLGDDRPLPFFLAGRRQRRRGRQR